MKMTIKIKVTNAFTNVVEIDNEITVDSDFQTAINNHECLKKANPDCYVNFTMDNGDFIYGKPYNMEQDELLLDQDLMTFDEYLAKWHGGVVSDIPDSLVEEQIDMLLEQDWDERDSYC